jgi:GDP/UDP-N,N'-diacetylbacillosamine 2-epimerase (hydrolysing)
MTRKICVLTGTRADYGLLRRLMRALRDDPEFVLQILVTGSHLSPEFGSTYKEIEQDGFEIDRKVEILLSADTPTAIGKSIGLGIIGLVDALSALGPDLLLVLGDRFEALAATVAALVSRIPVAHLHGGEVTEGAVDDAMRHAITKMSHVHFVATEAYRRRVIQLGEAPERVHCVGGLGVDAIAHLDLLDRDELESGLGIKLRSRNLLVTFHPATLDCEPAGTQMRELLAALEYFRDVGLIFTLPNADAGGRELMGLVEAFVASHENAHAFASLGQLRYLSCMRHVDGVIGNSSSGLLEAPTFHIGTINIGDRQHGRLQAASVINCPPRREAVDGALRTLFSPEFRAGLTEVVNPYGTAGASERIMATIKHLELEALVRKSFHDLPLHVFKEGQ